jgi:hypothetical protein
VKTTLLSTSLSISYFFIPLERAIRFPGMKVHFIIYIDIPLLKMEAPAFSDGYYTSMKPTSLVFD